LVLVLVLFGPKTQDSRQRGGCNAITIYNVEDRGLRMMMICDGVMKIFVEKSEFSFF